MTVEDLRRSNSTMDPDISQTIDSLQNPCKNLQPAFHPVTQLTPDTRYAAYVKTYTTVQDKKGAQSPIIYFTTLPGRKLRIILTFAKFNIIKNKNHVYYTVYSEI